MLHISSVVCFSVKCENTHLHLPSHARDHANSTPSFSTLLYTTVHYIPAFSNSDLITLMYTKCWRHVCRNVLMPFLVSIVFADIVQVVPSNDDGSVHLSAVHHTL